MMSGVLIDAGPLVALMNRSDRDHGQCVEVFKELHEPPLTTWMPVTEAMYLLGFSVAAQGALLKKIERGAIRILELIDEDLPGIRRLMKQYAESRLSQISAVP